MLCQKPSTLPQQHKFRDVDVSIHSGPAMQVMTRPLWASRHTYTLMPFIFSRGHSIVMSMRARTSVTLRLRCRRRAVFSYARYVAGLRRRNKCHLRGWSAPDFYRIPPPHFGNIFYSRTVLKAHFILPNSGPIKQHPQV